MLLRKSVVDDIVALARFEIFVTQLWRSLSNSANFGYESGAVLGNLRHYEDVGCANSTESGDAVKIERQNAAFYLGYNLV